ncbi:TIR domain-containing protein [Nocardia sp. NRRL S-836]|uniref:TIR domain-containing protein n=1 Tax=Nocardia sp. NRRL S-836 TaxID=1519492 RepID=UPI0006AE4D43|nr:TIR domain-containing protein [Nocardia sp. NRRL S-836]KOV81061.1 hypothetical protein ADL03_30015 [Nocardia sp. NRRL S-836]
MSGGIFVSYRKMHNGERRVHAQTIEAIVDRLRRHFGAEKVLVDMDLKAGDHYPSRLRGWLRDCEVVLVIIHREWLADLRARRGEQWDWARWEAETALAMGLHVVPVLLDNARLPGKDTLIAEGFPDLAELSTRQRHQIGFGEWQKLAELFRALEVRVATAPPPVPERPEPVRRNGFWPLAAVVTGLGVPWLAARLLVPDEQVRLAVLVALAIALNLLLVVPLGVVAFTHLARRRLDESDQRLAEISHDVKTNITVGLVVAGLGITVLLGSRLLPWQAVLPVLAVVVWLIVMEGHRWLHDRRGELWPYARLVPSPAAIRGALAHVRRFTAGRDLLTRVERDQVGFVLGQVEWARQRLIDLNRLGRWEWLRRSASLLPALHLLVLAAVIGSAAGAVVEGAGPDLWVVLAVSVVVAALCHLGAVELAFRRQHWCRAVVIDTTPAEADHLRDVLARISIPPARQENAG